MFDIFVVKLMVFLLLLKFHYGNKQLKTVDMIKKNNREAKDAGTKTKKRVYETVILLKRLNILLPLRKRKKENQESNFVQLIYYVFVFVLVKHEYVNI